MFFQNLSGTILKGNTSVGKRSITFDNDFSILFDTPDEIADLIDSLLTLQHKMEPKTCPLCAAEILHDQGHECQPRREAIGRALAAIDDGSDAA